MITDYASLQTDVLKWLNRAGDSEAVSNAPTWVQFAEDELRMALSRLKIRQGETVNTSYSIANEYNTLPTGFISARSIVLAGNPPTELQYVTPQAMGRYSSGRVDKPKDYTISGANLKVSPAPDSTYTATFTYYSLPRLSGSATTNWLITAYPKIYMWAVLAEAYAFYEAPDKRSEKLSELDGMLQRLETTEGQSNNASALQIKTDGGHP